MRNRRALERDRERLSLSFGGSRGAANPVYDSAAAAVFAAMTSSPTAARKALINTLIIALKSAGVWTKIDVLWVMAAHDEQAARINWKNPAAFPLVPTATVPVFTADQGTAGDGSSSNFTTGYDPSVASIGMTQDSAHIGMYSHTALGAAGSINNRVLVSTSSSTGVNVRVTCATTLSGTAAEAIPHHLMGIRRDSSNQLAFGDGLEVATAANASTLLPSGILIHKNASATFFAGRVAAAHVGQGFTDPEALACYNALHAYMIAVGADT
jgi:hypothetical protein